MNSHNLNISILSIDVGAFTQDILLWNGSYKSSFKLILPSPTVIFANKVKEFTKKRKDLVITGETMGGGPFNQALLNHVEENLNVYMTKNAARTVRDDPEYVQNKGIEIVDKDKAINLSKKEKIATIEIKDVDIKAITEVASKYGLTLEPSVVAIGVEDHGTFPDKKSDREIRFEHFKELIPADVDCFGFVSPPKYYTRMMGVKRTIDKDFHGVDHLIMDSKIAAMYGAAFSAKKDKGLMVDIGNGHTTIASMEHGKITGIFEHHTRMLTKTKIKDFINEFLDGTLTNSKIFDDGGHGCYISTPIHEADIIVSGPLRASLFSEGDDEIKFVNPFGDTMITGNVGLIECARKKYKI